MKEIDKIRIRQWNQDNPYIQMKNLENAQPGYRVHTVNDDHHLYELPLETQNIILDWVFWNFYPAQKIYPHLTSDDLKEVLYKRTQIHLHNNQFKEAMLINGFWPRDPSELNWVFHIQASSPAIRTQADDEYQYNIAEIGHNPYHLISYLTAKYGDWTYSDVENELQSLFEAQYHLNTEGRTKTVTETRNVRVGESLGQVVTSGYCNCRICCGVWSGGPTASGAYPTANHTIAVDASNPFVPIGTKVVMNGVEYTVEDTGAFARYGVQFDVYYDNHAAASAHGHQTWEAYIADDNGSQEVTVTSTSTKKILYVTLTNGGFDAVARANLNAEQLIIYNALNTTYGNRNYLWDVNNVTSGSGGNGMSYEIPPEALQDEEFARMIREAEKYLGVPYVWGGYSPSGFDCSGFVSYVINHCGNGWNYGRLTADGLRGVCTYVSPEEAKPGDLIFFQGTYNTSGASHVGIYVGNNMMIHCGDPIHYSVISH